MSNVGFIFDNNLHYYYDRDNLSGNINTTGIPNDGLTGTISALPFCNSLVRNTQTPSAVVSTGTACFQHTYFDDYYLRLHVNPNDLHFGTLLVTTQRSLTVYNSFLTSVKITAMAIIGLDEEADGLTNEWLTSIPITIPSLTQTTFSLTADIDAGNVTWEGTYQVTVDILDVDGSTVLDTLIVEIDTSGLRSSAFRFSPFKKMVHKFEWKTRVAKSLEGEQRASLISNPYETVQYSYRVPKQDGNVVIVSERAQAGLPIGVPIWADAIRVGAIEEGIWEIFTPIKGNSFEEGHDVMLWDSDAKAEIYTVDAIDYDIGNITLQSKTAFPYYNAFLVPIRIGYASKGTKTKNYGDGLLTIDATYELTTIRPDFVNDDLLVFHRERPLLTQKNFQKSSKESFGHKFDKLEGFGFGRNFNVKVGSEYYTRDYVWQCNNRDEIDAMHTFLHYVKGQHKSFYVPSFRPDFTLDIDITINAWVLYCKNARLPLETSFVDKSIGIWLNDGTFVARRIVALDNRENLQLVVSQKFDTAIAVEDVKMICVLELMRIKSDVVTVKYSDIDDVSCKLKLISVTDEEAYV